jgi:hypothetical protein
MADPREAPPGAAGAAHASPGAARWLRNAFYVLDLRPSAERAEVERAGGKLLSMLQVGLARARWYVTPLGDVERTPEAVREAMAELRDPDRRLMHELWATLPSEERPPAESASGGDASGWEEIWTAAGWRAPR